MRRVTGFVDRLLRQRRPRPFVPTDDEAAAMRAALTMRDAHPEAGMPRPEFVARLRGRLAEQASRTGETEPEPTTAGNRRALFVGASAAAAAAAVAVVVDHAVTGDLTPAAAPTLVPNDGVWRPVLASAALPDGGAATFDTGTVTGYLTRVGGTVAARSGICTHMQCRLTLNLPERRLDCPCHSTFFALDGTVIRSQLRTPPARLPAVEVRERDGQIEVFVPGSS